MKGIVRKPSRKRGRIQGSVLGASKAGSGTQKARGAEKDPVGKEVEEVGW